MQRQITTLNLCFSSMEHRGGEVHLETEVHHVQILNHLCIRVPPLCKQGTGSSTSAHVAALDCWIGVTHFGMCKPYCLQKI
jgi:hypothetical protein